MYLLVANSMTDSFADTQNFCHSHNVCALKLRTIMCHHHCPPELAAYVAMMPCCYVAGIRGLCLYIIHVMKIVNFVARKLYQRHLMIRAPLV